MTDETKATIETDCKYIILEAISVSRELREALCVEPVHAWLDAALDGVAAYAAKRCRVEYASTEAAVRTAKDGRSV